APSRVSTDGPTQFPSQDGLGHPRGRFFATGSQTSESQPLYAVHPSEFSWSQLLTAATLAALLAAAESSAWRRIKYQPSKTSIARSGDATASGWSSTAPLALTMPWRPLNRISGFSLECHTHSDCQKFAADKRTVRPSGNSSVPPPTQRG